MMLHPELGEDYKDLEDYLKVILPIIDGSAGRADAEQKVSGYLKSRGPNVPSEFQKYLRQLLIDRYGESQDSNSLGLSP